LRLLDHRRAADHVRAGRRGSHPGGCGGLGAGGQPARPLECRGSPLWHDPGGGGQTDLRRSRRLRGRLLHPLPGGRVVRGRLPDRPPGADHIPSLVLGTSVIFALVASWYSFASDYSRYLPERLSTSSVAGWIGAGTALSMFLFGSLGVLLASIDPKAGGNLLALISAKAPLSVVVPFLLFIAVGEVWANYLDVYTAGLSGLALNLRSPRWAAALACGAVGGVLAYIAMFVSNFAAQYTNFLLITYLWV